MQKVKDFVTSKYGMASSVAIALSTTLVASTAYAGVAEFVQKYVEGAYTLLLNIANPIALLAAAICLCTLFFSRNPQKAESAYSWLKNIILAFIVLNLLGAIVTWFIGQTNDIGGKDIDWSGTTAFIHSIF